jgi:drug/metabolite transporter (DMT)-like permease
LRTLTSHAPLRVSPAIAGLVFILASAIFLSALGVLTQLAFNGGATVGTVAAGRFLLAAGILWLIVRMVRARRPTRGEISFGLLLGVGYSAHAWLFSTSLTRLDVGLVDLLLFTYPAMVMLGAVALGRDRWSLRSGVALGTVTAGTALVLVGGLHSIDPLGAVLALGAAVTYAAYILTSAGRAERTDPFLLTALVSTGAAITLTLGATAQGDVSLDIAPSTFAFIVVAGLAVAGGMSTFIAGLSRLGPSRASIVSAVQPALTPALGFVVFADRLGPEQLLGGALVVMGVVILEAQGSAPALLHRLVRRPGWERRTLARVAGAMDVPSGRRLLHQGATPDAFFLIERGHASVKRDERQIADLGPGDFFGELGLLRGGARTASVEAATDMRVRVIPEPEFPHAMEKLPKLARSICDVASQRLEVLSGAG